MTDRYRLIIGNRNYSSWSMRAGVLMRHAGVDFDETIVPLFRDDTAATLAAFAPAPPRVPILIHGDLVIWDSLAIAEYLHERHPQAGLLPDESSARAMARSICAEMHSSFLALREAAPMNIRGRRARDLSSDVHADIARIESIWGDCLAASGGPFLFGAFCVADAYYAPVVMRFRTLAHRLPGGLEAYAKQILDHPAVSDWCRSAEDEPWVIEASE